MPYFQFQSHEAEFDYLKSLDIDEKLIQMKFFKNSFNDSQMMLTANGKKDIYIHRSMLVLFILFCCAII